MQIQQTKQNKKTKKVPKAAELITSSNYFEGSFPFDHCQDQNKGQKVQPEVKKWNLAFRIADANLVEAVLDIYASN